jgi:16S rRNA (cytosine967-C5)-methyltransferase
VPGSRAAAHGVSAARGCAYAVIERVFERGAYADAAMQAEAGGLDSRDRALAMRLAYGTIQRKATLDHFIEQLAERPAAALDAPVRDALRLGLYELLYLDGTPQYAAVAEAVELAKRRARGGHGLVNAVLRRAGREGAPRLLASLADATPEQAAIKHSHPAWLARLWWQALGADEARALMAVDNEPSELALRANTLVAGAGAVAAQLPVSARRDERIPEALVLEGAFDLHGSPLFSSGTVIAQSRAAMLVGRTLAPAPGERVLDLCAAPGGKATHLAALMEARGQVVAIERDRRRAGALVRTAQRMHARNVRVEVADATVVRAEEPFDRVLVDPPCSGLGTLQARPDLRWRISENSLVELARIQGSILDAGAGALRPGGLLVYSTCTISPDENERVIGVFLDGRRDFQLEGAVQQTMPHRDRTAGFYIARLRRS